MSSELKDLQISEVLKMGITDYVAKKNLSRLNLAIERAIAEGRNKMALEKLVVELRESNLSKLSLIQNTPGLVYRCSVKNQWKTEYLSDKCESVTSYTKSEFYEIGFAKIIHPDDAEAVFKTLALGLETRTSFDCEYRIVTKDKKIKFIWDRGIGVYGKDGEIEAIEGLEIDITEKRTLDIGIEEGRLRLIQAQKIGKIGSWEVDC